jgi:drug/metabolite transporter (DMT)-like permease
VTGATPPPGQVGRGLAWGLLAAIIWSAYSVLARQAVKAGLSPTDLTLLRFLPGGLLLAVWLWRRGLRDLGGLGWRRGLVLAMLAGPGFSLLIMGGFVYAPLAHGVVIAPACQMLTSLALGSWLAHQRWTRESAVGAALVTLGLAFVGGDGLLNPGDGTTPLGDLMFLAAGTSWGLFGALSRRWQVDPMLVTAVVAVLSLALFAPPYLLFADLGRLTSAEPGLLIVQLLAQGFGAGLVALLAYSRAAALLGSGRAGFFGAMVPAAASLLAIPVLGEVPGPLQVAGIVAVVLGLGVAFGAARVLLRG